MNTEKPEDNMRQEDDILDQIQFELHEVKRSIELLSQVPTTLDDKKDSYHIIVNLAIRELPKVFPLLELKGDSEEPFTQFWLGPSIAQDEMRGGPVEETHMQSFGSWLRSKFISPPPDELWMVIPALRTARTRIQGVAGEWHEFGLKARATERVLKVLQERLERAGKVGLEKESNQSRKVSDLNRDIACARERVASMRDLSQGFQVAVYGHWEFAEKGGDIANVLEILLDRAHKPDLSPDELQRKRISLFWMMVDWVCLLKEYHDNYFFRERGVLWRRLKGIGGTMGISSPGDHR